MAFLYGRAGRLTAKNGGFRRGQCAGAGACDYVAVQFGRSEIVQVRPAAPEVSPLAAHCI